MEKLLELQTEWDSKLETLKKTVQEMLDNEKGKFMFLKRLIPIENVFSCPNKVVLSIFQ